MRGHAQVVRSLFYIFQALNLGAVPYLPKVRSWLMLSHPHPDAAAVQGRSIAACTP